LSRLIVLAAPLLWAALVVFHPWGGDGNAYESIRDSVDRWIVVHVGQLVLTPLLFLTVWRLLAGLSSAAATVSRAALVVWAVFFSAYDSIQGVATGILVRHANGLTGDEQAAVARAIDYVVSDNRLAGNISAFFLIGQGSWLVVAIAAAVALHKAGAGKAVVIAVCLSTVFAVHIAPAAIGLVALFVAALLRERSTTHSSHFASPARERKPEPVALP
jgi:hypothetical protein